MKEKLKIAGYAQRGVVPLALGVAVTMWLWNALIPEIVGCIAGDNTLMCVARSADEGLVVMEKIRKMIM